MYIHVTGKQLILSTHLSNQNLFFKKVDWPIFNDVLECNSSPILQPAEICVDTTSLHVGISDDSDANVLFCPFETVGLYLSF